MARLLMCDQCRVATPSEATESLVDWLTVSYENEALAESRMLNFCSWRCVGAYAAENFTPKEGDIVEGTDVPVAASA